jgi:hypothetical protein
MEGTMQLNKETLSTYWTGFTPVAYALYNDEIVYMYNHPSYGEEYVLPWNEQFIGDTIMLYEGHPTAIVHTDRYPTIENFYSIIVHELFHGYQYIKGDTHSADELLAVRYPLLAENMEVRNRERNALYQAVITSKKEYITQFIALREKRMTLMNEYSLYETAIESMEGPALYVEMKAYDEKSPLSYEEVLHTYSLPLLHQRDSAMHIRRSCYHSGLFLCLLLDTLLEDWHETYITSNLSLYDFFREVYPVDVSPIDNVYVTNETIQLVEEIQLARENEFHTFMNQKGYHLVIDGPIKAKSFDPMNMLASDNKLLHRTFLKVAMNGAEYFIQQPVVSHYHDTFTNIHQLHLVLEKKPTVKENSIIVEGIGEIHGNFKLERKE